MRLSEILKGVDVLGCTANLNQEIVGVCADSRQVQPGWLFVASTAYGADRHAYLPVAARLGAAAAVCCCPPEEPMPYVLVSDTALAEAQIAANWYGHPADRMKLTGITGTNGKTTVTYLLKTVLEQTLGVKVGLIGTMQNLIGSQSLPTSNTTPGAMELQALLHRMAQEGCTHVVMEVSSHALALDRVAGLAFETAVFTNLTEDHLDFHKTMQAYGEAKALLFERCRQAVLNADDPAWEQMAAHFDGQPLTYGQQPAAALRAADAVLAADHVSFTAQLGGRSVPVRLGIPGGFTVYNALAALGAAHTLGVPLEAAAAALAQAHGVKGRVEVVPTPGQPYTILIDYAHTPDGLENVLRSVRGFAGGRVVAVFGCGGDRDPVKRPIMGRIAARLADLVVVTSDNPRTEEPGSIIRQILEGMQDTATPYVVVENRREAIRWAMDHAQAGDIIVLAGKGHETYQIIGTEKTHLDEREEVAHHLATKE